MRIHLVPQGVPEDRSLIISGILHSQAQKVFIIRNSNRKLPETEKLADKCIQQILHELENKELFWFIKEIDAINKSVNFFDLLQALGSLDSWIKQENESGNEVSVNISTGNKIVSLALAMAALNHGSKIFYFIPQDQKIDEKRKSEWSTNEEGYISKKPGDFIEIPQFPLHYMLGVPFNIISTLADMGGKAESLTELVKALFPKLSSRNEIRSKRVIVSNEIRQLESMGYVKTEKIRTERQVSLTSKGKDILHFVKYR